MRSTITRMMFAVAAALATSAAQPASISLSPANQGMAISAGIANVDLLIDFGTVRSTGGGLTLDISGPISFNSFSPSAFFDSFDVAKTTQDCFDLFGIVNGDPEVCDFTGFGTDSKPPDTEFEIHLGTFNTPSPLTGMQSLGTITVNLTDVGTGLIALAMSPDSFFGPFLTVGGTAIPMTLTGASIGVVPLPATAWLFATGFGLVGFWRRRRA